MNKLNLQTTDMVDENIKRIGELFPNCLTERLDVNGKPEMAIDFDTLRQELSRYIVEGNEERYQFTWPDKRNSIRLANAPTTDTLRPYRNESVDFDTTKNLYIEGDNLQVLKLLRENYLGKVKMIYIDPPYNTGNDFVYNDDFAQSADEYIHNSGQLDEEGNRLVTNTESNGRFHTDWLNMIYPRLKVAKDLLSEDGVIFISIDDNEVDDLKKMCNEIFGERNFIGCAGRITKKANNQGDYWAPNFDYILTFTKNKLSCPAFKGGQNDKSYNLIEEEGPRKGEKYQLVRLYMSNLDPMRGCTNQRYYIECPDGSFIIPPGENYPEKAEDGAFVVPQSGKDKIWRWSYQTYLEKKDQIVLKQGKSSNVVGKNGAYTQWNAFTKTYLNDVIEKSTATPNSFIEDHINQIATHELKDLDIPFSFPKPTTLIMYLASILNVQTNDIILDFFSGSATTGHAVMRYNFENNTQVKYVCVQLPEQISSDSDAYKAGYKNICEIGKERIRRAGTKIKGELQAKCDKLSDEIASLIAESKQATQLSLMDDDKDPKEELLRQKQEELKNLQTQLDNFDTGFRVLKLDTSNMEDVYYTPEEFTDKTLFDNNIKPDRTDEDLLFQTMIDLGIELSASIERMEIAGKTVWNVAENYLLACFDTEVNESTITAIARLHPYYFVMRDSSLANDNVADNFEQIFEHYSKDTIRRII